MGIGRASTTGIRGQMHTRLQSALTVIPRRHHCPMTAREVDRSIERLARRQHGVFSRPQARLAGASTSLIDRRLASLAWLRLDPAVYALPGNPPTWHRQLKAAELSVPGGVVSGRAAAALQELTGFHPGRPEITVAPTIQHRSRLARVHRSALVDPVTVAGIRVNSIAQTLIDVAGRVDERRLGRAFGDAVTSGRLDVSALAERFVLIGHSRRPGIGPIRRLLEQYGDGEAPPESALEAELLAAAAEAGLTGVVTQHPLPWWPHGAQRVDAFVPAARVILEADGRRWHTRVEDFDHDRWRDNQAVLHHWRPLRYTWRHLTRRRAEVVRDLRSLAAEIARASTPGFRGQVPERRPAAGQPAVYSSPDGRSVTAARPPAPSARSPSPSPAAASSSPRLASHSAGSIVSEE